MLINKSMLVFVTGFLLFGICKIQAGEVSRAFEFRYVTSNPAANGETDFKGETEVLNTEQRVDFLKQFAIYGKRFWNDPQLDREVVTAKEIESVLASIKPQPLPQIREEIRLQNWKWLGYRPNQREDDMRQMQQWQELSGVHVADGFLQIDSKDLEFSKEFTSQNWRFAIEWKIKVPESGSECLFQLLNQKEQPLISVGFNKGKKIYYFSATERRVAQNYASDSWYHIKIEADIPAGRYNLYIDEERIAYYVPMQRKTDAVSSVKKIKIKGMQGLHIDDFWGVGYQPTEEVRRPFSVKTFLDENFEIKPSLTNWNMPEFDYSQWQTTELPKSHGSERYAGEDLYLRKKVDVGKFTKAFLNIETLDPSGDIWINGRLVARSPNRHPIRLDVTEYLKADTVNLIAVKVDHFYLTPEKGVLMGHSPLDLNFGWFAGRMSLEITADQYIEDVFVYTQKTSDPAELAAKITVTNNHWWAFSGEIEIKIFAWYPQESLRAVVIDTFDIEVNHGPKIFEHTLHITQPKLWTSDNPNLYKIVLTLLDEQGDAIDDKVITTGIRTVSQLGGTFNLNGEPSMLNGAQIMGARSPLSKMIEWFRCPPLEWVAKEILMIKKMNGNLMRIHVHAWQSPAVGINDPRFAELGDQLGIMFIWSTPAWIRTGKGWGQIDFTGYPKYMKQVQNHPSIVMWEVSNHPNGFKERPLYQTNAFVEKAYQTVYPVDPSRLISFTSYIYHFRYANDDGTIDHQGNLITPAPEWTAKRVTRGNQDSYMGYGKEWMDIRKAPFFEYRPHLPDFLNSTERAYFNFEHEESIGQPNWNLVKGKPWYQIQSYEWDYDTGSIGRRLTAEEWMESQAWQAFSAYEAMRKQRIIDYDGFSWCCLHGGQNTATYKKPLIDFLGYAKLAFWANKMVFQNIIAGSDNVDVVYGPQDKISPMVINLGQEKTVNLAVIVKNMDNREVARKEYKNIVIAAGRTVTELDDFMPQFPGEGYYGIEYIIQE